MSVTTSETRDGFRPDVDAPTTTDDGLLDRARETAGDLVAAAEIGRYQGEQLGHEIADPKAERIRGDGTSVVRNTIAGGFQTLAVGAVTLAVTLFVTGMVFDVMPSDGAFAEETTEVESMTGDAFVLGGVALIILVASLILYLVSGFGDRRAGRI